MKVYRVYNNILLDCVKFWLLFLVDILFCLLGGVILDIIVWRIGIVYILKYLMIIVEKKLDNSVYIIFLLFKIF